MNFYLFQRIFIHRIIVLVFLLSLNGCVTTNSSNSFLPPANFPAKTQQAIVVEPLTSSRAKVTTWEFKNDRWQKVFWPMKAMVGRKGIAPFNEKREGDGRTPSGIYPITTAFGYASSFKTKLSYRQATSNDFWVDDVKSPQYNQWVTGKPNADSFEEMHRHDDLYKYGAVIEYNTSPIVPGNGSAIFIHIWRRSDRSTSGCVALSPRSLRHVLGWLDAAKSPSIVIIKERSSSQ